MKILLVAFVSLLLVSTTAFAQRSDTLRGLTGVSVRVQLLDASEKAGLNDLIIKSEVELQLRKSMIRIVQGESEGTVGFGRLDVEVTTLAARDDSQFVAHVEISFSEPAMMLRTQKRTFVMTWGLARMVGSASEDFDLRVRGRIADMVTIFANDFLSVNRK